MLPHGHWGAAMSAIASSGIAGENWTACVRATAEARISFWRLMNPGSATVSVSMGVQSGGNVTVIGQAQLVAGGSADVLDSGEELALVNGETAVVKCSSAAAGVSFRLGGTA